VNQILHMNADEITYLQNYTYTFDPSRSCPNCSENDMFYTPNAPYLVIISIMEYNPILHILIVFMF